MTESNTLQHERLRVPIGTLTIGSSGVAGALAKAQGVSSRVWNPEPSGHPLFERATESSSQGRVLVADDEGPPRKALRASLSMSGFSVQEARNGWEALGMLREHTFDLVLLATKMLRVSCTEACRRIRGISAQAGIVMITVGDLEDDRIRALDAGRSGSRVGGDRGSFFECASVWIFC